MVIWGHRVGNWFGWERGYTGLRYIHVIKL